jgi:putative transposase
MKLRTDAALYYWADFGTTIEDAYAELQTWVDKLNGVRAAMHLKPVRSCSFEWLRIRISETEEFKTYSTKFGKEAAERRFKANGIGSKAGQLLELGFIDHHTWDNYCAVEEIDDELLPVGRPTVTAVYEQYSSCILSAVLHLTDPSLDNMLDALKEANRPKLKPTKVGTDAGKNELLANIYGKLDTIVPDNAWEFTGSSGQDCFADVGMSVDWARAGEAQDKSPLERFWRFLSLTLARKLPHAILDIRTTRLLGLKPCKVKAVLASDIRALLAEVVAYWHLRLHRGINAQPARLWEKAVRKRGGSIPVIRDHNKLDQMMGQVVETTLTTSGVTMFGDLGYTDREQVDDLLNRLAGTSPKGRTKSFGQTARVRVKVKYNPANISRVHVYDRSRGDYATLTCTDENYVRGLSLKHHDAVKAWVACQNLAFNTPNDRKRARASLNQAIRERAPQLAMRHRKKFAALVEGGAGGSFVDGVAVAHAPSSYSGMAPTIGHETAVATRSDKGQLSKTPAPRKRRPSKSGSARSPNAVSPHATTGKPADFTLATGRAAIPGGGDWSGLN